MAKKQNVADQPLVAADDQGAGTEATTEAPSEPTTEETTSVADEPEHGYAFPTPREFAGQPGVDLLMEACSLYGINPDAEAEPVQLLGWKFYPGDRRKRLPDRVRLVTAGGLKLAHPADEDTIDRLQRVFRLVKEARKADGSIETTVLPMPEDLVLPSVHVTGKGESEAHVYRRGYLREGGASEATRRAARRHAGVDR